jgi:2-keto-myo-inositol isomerase
MQPALSQVCTLHADFETDLADYAAGACHAVEVWLGKLETWLQNHSVDDVRRLIDQHGLSLPAASYQGGLLTSQGEARREHWDHFGRRLDLCQQLGIPLVIVAADVTAPVQQVDIERTQVSLVQMAQQAAERGIRVALEFQARSALANNLQTAVALIEAAEQPNLGLCLDTFHFFTGPSKTEDLAYLTPENLFHVQLSDLSGVARELATDSHRILPGEGDLPVAGLIEHLKMIGYQGTVSLELMNPEIWQVPPRQFGEIAITSLRRVLGQASMG